MAKKNKRKSDLQTSDTVLQAILGNSKHPLARQFQRWKLWHKWPEIVGKNLANVSEPVGLYNDTLWVWVKNSTWMQELQFIKKPICDKVNQHVGEAFVKQVRFTLDRKSVPKLSESSPDLRNFLSK